MFTMRRNRIYMADRLRYLTCSVCEMYRTTEFVGFGEHELLFSFLSFAPIIQDIGLNWMGRPSLSLPCSDHLQSAWGILPLTLIWSPRVGNRIDWQEKGKEILVISRLILDGRTEKENYLPSREGMNDRSNCICIINGAQDDIYLHHPESTRWDSLSAASLQKWAKNDSNSSAPFRAGKCLC